MITSPHHLIYTQAEAFSLLLLGRAGVATGLLPTAATRQGREAAANSCPLLLTDAPVLATSLGHQQAAGGCICPSKGLELLFPCVASKVPLHGAPVLQDHRSPRGH